MIFKKALITILKFACIFNCTAQFQYDYDGKIVPFSLSEKYSHLIDTSKINTLELPSYDNDSLYWYANFERKYIKKERFEGDQVGKNIDTLINIKQVSTKYKINCGNIWLYKIRSKTSEGITIVLSKFKIPKGASWSVYGEYRKWRIDFPTIHDSKSFNKWSSRSHEIIDMKKGKELIIEYFEPNNPEFSPELIINKITYVFSCLKRKRLENVPESLKKKYPSFDFQKDTRCRK